MTTIAYRAGVVAADSRCENNGWIGGHSIKKVRKSDIDGCVYAITGNAADSTKVMEAFVGGQPQNDINLGESSRVVKFDPSGEITVYEGNGSFTITCEYTAFGSGSPAALAAMMMGASARKAVEIAAQIDPYTGGEVIVMKTGVD